MDFKPIIIFGLLVLICCCFRRQKRYFLELLSNAPSASIRIAYKFSILLFLFHIFIPNELSLNELILTICLLCLKITISPTLIAITLFISTIDFYVYDIFPFYEVWTAICSILLWRLPEDARAIITSFGLIWSSINILTPRILQKVTFNII